MNDNPEASDCVNTIVLFVNTGLRVFSETLMDQVFWTTFPLTFTHHWWIQGGVSRDAKQWRIKDFPDSPIPNGRRPTFLAQFCRKLHENGENWTEKGGVCASKILLCGSATVKILLGPIYICAVFWEQMAK